jgi:hypothetical protein
MPNDTNLAEISPSERRREISSILARGILLLHHRHFKAEINSANSEVDGLEVSPHTVLSVTNPVNGPESPEHGASA